MSKSVVERLLSRPAAADVSDEEWRRREDLAERARRSAAAAELIRQAGGRYDGCTVASFEIAGDERTQAAKRDAIERLTTLGKALREHRDAGGNLFIYGPPGTGKDHLMIALMRHAILGYGMNVHWCNGQTLFGDFRDNIDRSTSERELLAKYVRPDILGISDPVPPKGEISTYASSMLYRIIDERYRRLKPTWATVNVSKRDEAVKELTGPIYDRLCDNAVTVFCNWASYRQSRRAEFTR